MKTVRKCLAVILALIMLISALPAVFAQEVSGEDSPVLITVVSDKEKYKPLDVATFTVKVENISDEELTGVVLAADSDRFLLKHGASGNFGVGTLAPGESKEFSFSAVIRNGDSCLNIIQRIILLIKYLVCQPAKFKKIHYSSFSKFRTETEFTVTLGDSGASVSATCWWNRTEQDDKIKITFDTGEGDPVPAKKVERGEEAGELPYPSMDGYYFSGWYEDTDFTVPFAANSVVEDDITVHAQFTERGEELKETEPTEYYEDECDTDKTVTVICEDEITVDNLSDYVTIDDGFGEAPKVTVTPKGDNEYEIAAVNGFDPGWMYTFTAAYGVSFKGLEESIYSYSFRIKQEEICEADRKDNIIYIDKNDVSEISADNRFLITPELFDNYGITVNSVVCIGTGTEGDTSEDCRFLTVKDIAANGVEELGDGSTGGVYEITCEDPDILDVYDDVDIYFVRSVTNKLFSDTDEEEIAEEIRNNGCIDEVNALMAGYMLMSPTFVEAAEEPLALKAANVSGDPEFTNNAYITADNIQSIEDRFDHLLSVVVHVGTADNVVNKNFDNPDQEGWTGLEFTFTYEGQITPLLRVKASFTFKEYINMTLQGKSDVKIRIFGDDHVRFDYALNCYTQTTIGLNVLVATDGTNNMKDITDEILRVVNGHDGIETDALLENLSLMVGNGSGYIKLLSLPIIKFRLPVGRILQVNLGLDFVVKINIAAGIGVEYTILDGRQIGFKGDTSTDTYKDYQNELDGSNRYDLTAEGCGFIGVRAGFEGTVSVSFIGLDKLGEVGVRVGFGVYVETYCYAQFRLLKANSYTEAVPSLKGTVYTEFGIYIEVSVFARALKLEISETLYGKKFPLLTWGSKYLLMGIEEVPDGRILMKSDEIKVEDLPQLTGKVLDITTGVIERGVPISWNDLSISFDNIHFYSSLNPNNGLLSINHTPVPYHAEMTTATVCNRGAMIAGAGDTLRIPVAWTDGQGVDSENVGKMFRVKVIENFDGVKTVLADRMMLAGVPAADHGEFPNLEDPEVKEYWDAIPDYTLVNGNMTFTITRNYLQRKVAYLYRNETNDEWVVEVRVLQGNETPSCDVPVLAGNRIFTGWSCLNPDGTACESKAGLPMPVDKFKERYPSRVFCGLDKNAVFFKASEPQDRNIYDIVLEYYLKYMSDISYLFIAEYDYAPCTITVNCLDNNGNPQVLSMEKQPGTSLDFSVGCPSDMRLLYLRNDDTGEINTIDYWRCVLPQINEDTSFTAVYDPKDYPVQVEYYDGSADEWKTAAVNAVDNRIDLSDLSELEACAYSSDREIYRCVWKYSLGESPRTGCESWYGLTETSILSKGAKIRLDFSAKATVTLDYEPDGVMDKTYTVYSNEEYWAEIQGYPAVPDHDDLDYGYKFAGWLDESGGTLYNDNAGYSFRKNTLLVPKWEIAPRQYTVSLYTTYGTLKNGNKYCEYSVPSTELESFIADLRTEYAAYEIPDEITGYYTYQYSGALNVGEKYEEYGDYKVDIALDWTGSRNKYTVTFVYGNGTPDTTGTYFYDDIFPAGYAADYSKAPDDDTAYVFVGWDSDNDGIADILPGEEYRIIGNATLRIVWEEQQRYAVTLIYGNGIPDKTEKYVIGDTFVPGGSFAFAKDEDDEATYTFGGWDTDGDGIADFAGYDPFTVTGAATLRLIWVPEYKSYNVRYYVDGVLTNDESEKVNDSVAVRAKYTRDGYAVTDWTTEDAAVSDGAFTMPAKDVSFYATSAPNTYNITYMVDGAEWSADTAACDSSVTVPLPEAPDGEKMFTGWLTDDGRTVTSTFAMPPRDITLTAVFEDRPQKMINVIFFIDGNVYEIAKVSPGEIIGVPDPGDITVDGVNMTFSGWGSDNYDPYGDAFILGEDDGPAVRLYGTYTPADNPVTVTLTLNNDEADRTFQTLHLAAGEEYDLPVFGAIKNWQGEGVTDNVLTVPSGKDSVKLTAAVSGRSHTAAYLITNVTETVHFESDDESWESRIEKSVVTGEKVYLPAFDGADENVCGWVSAEGIGILSDSNGEYYTVPDYDVCFCFINRLTSPSAPTTRLYVEYPAEDSTRPGEAELIAEIASDYVSLPVLKLKGYMFAGWYCNGEPVDREGNISVGQDYYCRFKKLNLSQGKFYTDGELTYSEVFYESNGCLEMYEPEIGSFINPTHGNIGWYSYEASAMEGIQLLPGYDEGDEFTCFRSTCEGDVWVVVDANGGNPYDEARHWIFSASPGDTIYFPVLPGMEYYSFSPELVSGENGEYRTSAAIEITESNGFYSFTIPENAAGFSELYIDYDTSRAEDPDNPLKPDPNQLGGYFPQNDNYRSDCDTIVWVDVFRDCENFIWDESIDEIGYWVDIGETISIPAVPGAEKEEFRFNWRAWDENDDLLCEYVEIEITESNGYWTFTVPEAPSWEDPDLYVEYYAGSGSVPVIIGASGMPDGYGYYRGLLAAPGDTVSLPAYLMDNDTEYDLYWNRYEDGKLYWDELGQSVTVNNGYISFTVPEPSPGDVILELVIDMDESG